MRDEELKLGTVSSYYGGLEPYLIKGLSLIEPFGYIEWGRYKVYTTKSIMTKKTPPIIYLLRASTDDIRIFNHSKMRYKRICIGEFYLLMSKEEQAQFDENVVPIYEILGMK